MIYSQELEKKVLSGLIQHQHLWGEISQLLTEGDFYSEESKVHRSIFLLIKHALNNAEKVDDIILIERIKQLGVSFPDGIDVPEYIRGLSFFEIDEESFLTSIRELKKFSVRREILNSCKSVARFVKKIDPNVTYSEIIDKADNLYNEPLKKFERGERSFVNLFEQIPDMVEERGNNPIEEFGFMGPYPTINKIFGSLLRPGNISVIVARSGVGKSLMAMDYMTKVACMYGVPILHLDNGEMSEEELAFRQVAAVSKIPLWLLETGKWRSSSYGDLSPAQVVHAVRSSYKQIKDIEFYYENVAGKTPDEIVGLVKRFYYSVIGRGNPMLLSFDYIKSDFTAKTDNSFREVASLVDKFKQTIHRELCFDGKPCVAMFTAVQSNRSGIVNNRNANNIIDDESIVGLSDAITHFCSHLFILRRKVLDEITEDGPQFGTHKLIPLKFRHLGRDIAGALYPVELPDGSKKNNFINLEINNFSILDKGDLRDIVAFQTSSNINVSKSDDDDDDGLPDSLK